jgi:undecaprenyl-diphosphatase
VHGRFAVRAYFILVAALLTTLVGFGRVYLGVHWPTDVIGGWAAGAAWAIFCWAIALWLQKEGKVEKATPTPSTLPADTAFKRETTASSEPSEST